WGKMGHTHVRLAAASEDVLTGALRTAWKMRMDKNAKTSRKKHVAGRSGGTDKKRGEWVSLNKLTHYQYQRPAVPACRERGPLGRRASLGWCSLFAQTDPLLKRGSHEYETNKSA